MTRLSLSKRRRRSTVVNGCRGSFWGRPSYYCAEFESDRRSFRDVRRVSRTIPPRYFGKSENASYPGGTLHYVQRLHGAAVVPAYERFFPGNRVAVKLRYDFTSTWHPPYKRTETNQTPPALYTRHSNFESSGDSVARVLYIILTLRRKLETAVA